MAVAIVVDGEGQIHAPALQPLSFFQLLLNSFLLVLDGHPESLLQEGELTDEVCDGIGESLLGAVVWGGLHTNDDLVLQGVRDFVAGKQHLRVLQQLRFNDVPQSVVFFVDGEQASVGHLGVLVNGDFLLALEEQERLEGRRGVHPQS